MVYTSIRLRSSGLLTTTLASLPFRGIIEKPNRLEMTSTYRLRDFVNRIHHGSLNNPMLNSNKVKIPTLIFGTVNGAIIVDVSLHYKQYHMLEKLQANLRKKTEGLRSLNHEQWRLFHDEKRMTSAKEFIDGDPIESFIDFGNTLM